MVGRHVIWKFNKETKKIVLFFAICLIVFGVLFSFNVSALDLVKISNDFNNVDFFKIICVMLFTENRLFTLLKGHNTIYSQIIQL